MQRTAMPGDSTLVVLPKLTEYLLFEDEFSPVIIQSYNVWSIQWRLWCQMFGNGGVPHYTLVM